MSVYFSTPEKGRILTTAFFFGLRPAQLSRLFILNGLSNCARRVETAKELGYALE